MRNFYLLIVLFFTVALQAQPCFQNRNVVITSAYATNSDGKYKDDILWLTWGGKTTGYDFGTPDVILKDGDKSFASIPLGNNKYLCVEATIEMLNDNRNMRIKTYRPGNYSGDSMDNWYNIGGTDQKNRLIAGIANNTDRQSSYFRVKVKASISGIPVQLKGMVVADAESMDGSEFIRAKGEGEWKILEVKKRTERSEYLIRKDNSRNIIQFGPGNNYETAALAVLKFNNSAYNSNNENEVSVDFYLKGSGHQAVAIGLITPGVDLGDAPESYGSPIHTLERFDLSDDGIGSGTFSSNNISSGSWFESWPFYSNKSVNINKENYKESDILPNATSYLGSAKAEPNVGSVHGIQADGDGKGTNEEDAWPAEFKQFTLKAAFYQEGQKIIAKIPYHSQTSGYITAWIDLNGDGKFGSNGPETIKIAGTGGFSRSNDSHFEFAFATISPNQNGIATLEWTIPEQRTQRNTFVRLRIAEQFNEISSPISAAINGEVEDHKIYIIAPAVTNPVLKSNAK
ncbi:hypothetical protein K5I29_04545 [Flavobacterium agricola]|uniref:Uncharacterized protein n=1 Tax=Flavobacterium agricola TaxID=2870839 RepID=A0ABY6M1Q4_9FLAO|nr:CshA/CshB family fibrillar adhesin-related protein [Flavobacterium agricola]UYW02177.1 hypothetical protein K5I29_04545 [Flavobacterium agricola]